MNQKEFIKAIEELGIKLTNQQLAQLEKFYNLLSEWNEKINLTRITNKEDVYLKHFYDSLTITRVVDLTKINTLCDVGTGAGFPGVVLKICFPNLNVTLVDSLNKRVNYLNDIIEKLSLKNIKALHARGEEFKGDFDIVTARAVANTEKLLKYTMHLVNKQGLLIAMKGNVDNELTPELITKINKLYKLITIDKFTLPVENSHRSLVVIGKKGFFVK